MATSHAKSAPSGVPGLEDLRKTIRDAGLRCTGSRIAVLRLLHESETPVTHNEASEKLASLGFDHATIYRNLNDFTEARIAARTDLGDHMWRFELQRGSADHKRQHPHFLCTDCGDVSCLPETAVALKAGGGTPRAFRKGELAVQVQGQCDECQRAG